MRTLSIDQSMASCAYVVLEDTTPIFKEVLHTTNKETKDDWKVKFEAPVEQMDYISNRILEVYKSFNVGNVVLESLSFGSVGDQTRDLAGLFFSIQLTLLRNGVKLKQLHTIAPTSVKSWARGKLPEESQTQVNDKGKLAKKKMGKNEMMEVCSLLEPGFLDGYNKSGKKGGATDLADAYLIGRCFVERTFKL